MYLTEEGLRQVERHAEKKKDVSTMFMVQILRELRELRALFEQANDTGYSGDDSANCANESKY